MKINYLVGNDNGNHEQDLVVNGKMYPFPNVYSVVTNTVDPEDVPTEELIPNLLDRLHTTVQSRNLLHNTSVTVFVGQRAINEGETIRNMNLKVAAKHKQDLPLINTLSNLAAIAVKEAFNKKKKVVKEIELIVDYMTTALPASQWTKDNAEYFSNRFTGEHLVTVHVGDTDIIVKINIKNTRTVKEGVVALFALIENEKGEYRNDDLFKEFKEEYSLEDMDGSFFEDIRIVHSDIGDGTTEYAVTEGYETNGRTHGKEHGIGRTMELAIKNFSEIWGTEPTRQVFASYLKNEKSKFHEDAVSSMATAKKELANIVLEEIMTTSKDLGYDYEVLAVYGGGSIQLKDVLWKELKEFCDSKKIKLLWVPKEYATTLNARGLEIFTNLAAEKLKESAVQE
ncbi:TPA: hypothetical protein ACG05V_005434 [Bacillus pacificus]|uniref:ParM/StbA family protein n=1 Tax=Bacillus TaxID=1386 RepID=UPI0029C23517|nr:MULTISPECIES: ParM/StbA family protein [unclassified Bacillus cereus group]MDX5839885.1 ParM/StbA family protein [Bacillus cereus group sp. BfR-BA-01700]MDX5846250.1 ParM/StbA family protein [Bacillus cereus group sp. BfR-BA-01233]MDX5941836.1 ParM/StbA family protein [Bacillus cereus group sp. BfR-BA-00415]